MLIESHLEIGLRLVAKKFFDERTDQSEVKARIVQKYFYVWAKVISPSARSGNGRIAYIDLYAGPGRYKDGAASTPLLILEKAIEDDQLSQMLVTFFNDSDGNHTKSLAAEIAKLPNLSRLKYKPHISCGEIDEEAEKYFSDNSLVPSFSFVDPFGYKGLSLRIVHGVIKDWGCDCVFFFNYARINAGITNRAVQNHIDALFGQERADKLRKVLPSKRPHEREALILEELAQAIKGMGGTYVLPFRFKNASGKRTSHSLVFVSKHFKGYEIMKDIMAKESSVLDQGVPSFTYSPADESTPLLFSLSRPLEELQGSLMDSFAGQTIKMVDVYMKHSVDTPYIKKNYKEVLAKLADEGRVTVTGNRRKGSFADHLVVAFPGKPHG